MTDRAKLQVVIPFHAPIHATPEQISTALDGCYLPLLDAIDAIDARADARIARHFGGHLPDYLVREREEVITRIKGLARTGQAEILGGLFYGAIPALAMAI